MKNISDYHPPNPEPKNHFLWIGLAFLIVGLALLVFAININR